MDVKQLAEIVANIVFDWVYPVRRLAFDLRNLGADRFWLCIYNLIIPL